MNGIKNNGVFIAITFGKTNENHDWDEKNNRDDDDKKAGK